MSRVGLAAVLACSAAFGAQIPAGAHVLLRMVSSVNTRTAREGDYVYMQTATPIVVDGNVTVAAGSYVQGVVAHVQRSGRVKGRAELGLRLETLTLPAGKTLKFAPRLSSVDDAGSGQSVEQGENVVRQAPEKLHDVGRVAIWAGSGAAIGGLADRAWRGAGIGAGAGGAVGLATVLLSRGREVELRRGATIDVVFDRPISLD